MFDFCSFYKYSGMAVKITNLKCSFYCVISFDSCLLFKSDNVVYVAFYPKYLDDFTTSKP